LSDWKKCLFIKLLKDQDRINVSDSCYMVEHDPLVQCSPLLDDLTPSSLHLPYLYRKCIDHPTCAATRAPTGTTSSSTRILHPGITTTSSWLNKLALGPTSSDTCSTSVITVLYIFILRY
jgi:hypothetical protein